MNFLAAGAQGTAAAAAGTTSTGYGSRGRSQCHPHQHLHTAQVGRTETCATQRSQVPSRDPGRGAGTAGQGKCLKRLFYHVLGF